MTTRITLQQIQNYQNQFNDDPTNIVLQNVISKNKFPDLALNRTQANTNQHIFSNKTEPRVSVTNQKSTGRCWMFAGLNIIRREIIKKYNLPTDFELSQSYLFFWDKLERINYNLECIIDSSELNINDRLVNTILNDPLCDGGQWDMFVNLIKKYGVVPKSVYGESFHTSNSGGLEVLFKRKFREASLKLRKLVNEESGLNKAREFKEEFMQFTYNTLCKLFGTPITSNFVWEFVDKDDKYHRHTFDSPQQFYSNNVDLDLDDFVCLINDPRSEHEYYKLYTVKYLGNIVGGKQVKYLNVPVQDMKNATLQSLNGNDAVWFGCDVGKELCDNLMSINVKQYDNLLNTTFSMTKEDRLNTTESAMTHAMVFSGYNTYETNGEQVVDRWEVENSWGKKGNNNGYYTMTDEWFDEYMYEVVVHKKYVNKEINDAYNQTEITELPLWDPMGALAF